MRARMQERREIAPSTNVSAESWKLLAAEQKRKSKMDIWMTGFSLCIGHFKQGGGGSEQTALDSSHKNVFASSEKETK